MRDVRQQPDDRTHRRRIEIENREVRLHAQSKRSDLGGRADTTRRIHSYHVDDILRCRADTVLLLATASSPVREQADRYMHQKQTEAEREAAKMIESAELSAARRVQEATHRNDRLARDLARTVNRGVS